MPVIFSSAPARCLAPSGPRPLSDCGMGVCVRDAEAVIRLPRAARSRVSARPRTRSRTRPPSRTRAPAHTRPRGRAPAARAGCISAPEQPPAPARPPPPSSAAASAPCPGRLMVSARDAPGRAGLSRLAPAGPPCRAGGMLSRPTPGRVRRARRSGGPGRTGSAWRRAGAGPGRGVVRTRAGGGRRRTREQRGGPRRRRDVRPFYPGIPPSRSRAPPRRSEHA